VELSGNNQIDHLLFLFLFFLLLLLGKSIMESHRNPTYFFFFKVLGTIKEMCPQQVYRQRGEMESRLGHESAGWDMSQQAGA
jgi:cytochrome b561